MQASSSFSISILGRSPHDLPISVLPSFTKGKDGGISQLTKHSYFSWARLLFILKRPVSTRNDAIVRVTRVRFFFFEISSIFFQLLLRFSSSSSYF
jgi:hypothetical protein